METADASTFRDSLDLFTDFLHVVAVDNYRSFHAVTTVFEYFAAYLISRCCRVAFLLPQSWIDFHFPWFAQGLANQPTYRLHPQEIDIYAKSLLHLIACFGRLLSLLRDFPGQGFSLGLRTYPFRLLHRRNAELLALGIINLGFSHPRIDGFSQARETVSQVCLRVLVFPVSHDELDLLPSIHSGLLSPAPDAASAPGIFGCVVQRLQ
jgi:hypothetical protein